MNKKSSPSHYYYSVDDQRIGPVSGKELKTLAAAGKILPQATIWKEGLSSGVPAANLDGLFHSKTTELEPKSSAKYKAFISYSHNDAAVAVRVHSALERVKLPSSRWGSSKFRPVFLDKAELGSGGALSERLKDALDASESLIVLCSPVSRRSKWVATEIDYFLKSHSPQSVHALIVDGAPNAENAGLPPEMECLPDSIKNLSDLLAVDIRPTKDPVRLAVRRLAGDISGVGFTAIQRRHRNERVLSVTVLAIFFAILIVGQLNRQALQSSNKALVADNSKLVESRQELEAQVKEDDQAITQLSAERDEKTREAEAAERRKYFSSIEAAWAMAGGGNYAEARKMLSGIGPKRPYFDIEFDTLDEFLNQHELEVSTISRPSLIAACDDYVVVASHSETAAFSIPDHDRLWTITNVDTFSESVVEVAMSDSGDLVSLCVREDYPGGAVMPKIARIDTYDRKGQSVSSHRCDPSRLVPFVNYLAGTDVIAISYGATAPEGPDVRSDCVLGNPNSPEFGEFAHTELVDTSKGEVVGKLDNMTALGPPLRISGHSLDSNYYAFPFFAKEKKRNEFVPRSLGETSRVGITVLEFRSNLSTIEWRLSDEQNAKTSGNQVFNFFAENAVQPINRVELISARTAGNNVSISAVACNGTRAWDTKLQALNVLSFDKARKSQSHSGWILKDGDFMYSVEGDPKRLSINPVYQGRFFKDPHCFTSDGALRFWGSRAFWTKPSGDMSDAAYSPGAQMCYVVQLPKDGRTINSKVYAVNLGLLKGKGGQPREAIFHGKHDSPHEANLRGMYIKPRSLFPQYEYQSTRDGYTDAYKPRRSVSDDKTLLVEFPDFSLAIEATPKKQSSVFLIRDECVEMRGKIHHPRTGTGNTITDVVFDRVGKQCFWRSGMRIVCLDLRSCTVATLVPKIPPDLDFQYGIGSIILIPNSNRLIVGNTFVERDTGQILGRFRWKSVPLASSFAKQYTRRLNAVDGTSP